jgi:hypothetical protein
MFPAEETRVTTKLSQNAQAVTLPQHPALFDQNLPESQVYKESRTWKQVWFSGAFTYHLPTGYRSRNALERYGTQAGSLVGLDLSPETLWNLAPWSWAIDWFSNAGDVISNLSDWATDGLVLRYGYVMEHSFATDLYYMVGRGRLRQPLVHVSPIAACVESKRREVATPFGFGLSWSGLSPRQLSIAAALGLSRR